MTRLATFLAATALGAGGAAAATLDFEGFAPNDVVTSVTVAGVDATVTTVSNGPVQEARIFDTLNPTGNDDDLSYPGGQFGNVLIIQTDDDEPNDEAAGGTITFAFDRLVNFDGFTGLDDIDVTVSSNNGFSATLPIPADNGVGSLSGLGFTNVSTLTFDFSGSGAIDALEITPIPVPAALPLLGLALGGLAYAGRRRRG